MQDLRELESTFIEMSQTNSKLRPGLLQLNELLNSVEVYLGKSDIKVTHKIVNSPLFKRQVIPQLDNLPEDLSQGISNLVVNFSHIIDDNTCRAFIYLRMIIHTKDVELSLSNFNKLQKFIPTYIEKTDTMLPLIICDCVRDMLELLEKEDQYMIFAKAQVALFIRLTEHDNKDLQLHASIVCCAFFYYLTADVMLPMSCFGWDQTENILFHHCWYIHLQRNLKNGFNVNNHIAQYITESLNSTNLEVQQCGREMLNEVRNSADFFEALNPNMKRAMLECLLTQRFLCGKRKCS